MEHRYGHDYPEGGRGQELIAPDICPKCWWEKVKPALEAAGVPMKYKEYDW
jgi:hypothetical protein